MKKRIFSIFCVLCLVLTMLPATAWAAADYDFTVDPESLDFGTVSLVSNPSKTVTITNTGTKNIIVRVKSAENPNTYFVLSGNRTEYELKTDESGVGYFEATVSPGSSVHMNVQVNYTKLTDTESMDYDGTITFPVYEDDGSTLIEKNITATFNWVTAEQAMEVSETALNLGTVGQGYGDTQPVTFTITNTGQLKLDVVHCDLSFDDGQDADEKYYVTSYFKLTPNIFIPAISGSEYKF